MSEQLSSLLSDFVADGFGRLCKYECDYDLSDPDHPKNITLVDSLLGGDPSPELLHDKIIQKRALLTQIGPLLEDKSIPDAGALVSGLLDVIDVLEIGLVHELTKSGAYVNTPTSDLADVEQKIWGSRISDSPEDMSLCSVYVSQFPISERLLEYCKKLGLTHSLQAQTSQSSDMRAVSREDYVSLYQSVITDIYGLDAKVAVSPVANIVATGDQLCIPDSEQYALMPLVHVLELLAHEIEVHLVTSANHHTHFSYLPISPKHLIREEGLALFMEYQVFGKQPRMSTRSQVEILAGEILPSGEFLDWMYFFGELHGDVGEAIYLRYLRRKRLYPFDTVGVQHKDTAYDRGYRQVDTYLREGGDIRTLYSAHVPLDVHLQHPDTMLPQFFASYCVFRMSDQDDFGTYLEESCRSYPGISSALSCVSESRLAKVYDQFSYLFENE